MEIIAWMRVNAKMISSSVTQPKVAFASMVVQVCFKQIVIYRTLY